MVRRFVILLGGVFLLSLNIFATTWKSNGDLEAGLMIVYKTLPPLIVEVEKPQPMVVPRSKGRFKYSEVTTASNKVLNVKVEVKFNDGILTNEGINKTIVTTIYDTAKLSFRDNGVFKLIKTDGGENVAGSEIDGEVFFTNNSGIIEQGGGKNISKQLVSNTSTGSLGNNDIYIDAEFNKEGKELMTGNYSGTATLVVEFVGKEAGTEW